MAKNIARRMQIVYTFFSTQGYSQQEVRGGVRVGVDCIMKLIMFRNYSTVRVPGCVLRVGYSVCVQLSFSMNECGVTSHEGDKKPKA
jgi:hypothetical protein